MAGITAKDLAKRLGISPAAISLALNGKPGVSEQTRALVLETAMQMGYKRKEPSGNVHAGKTICFIRYGGTVINAAAHTSFATYILQGIETRAAELGYSTQVRHLNTGDMYNRQILEQIRRSAGVIFLGTDLTEQQLPEMEFFLSYLDECPVVIVDSLVMAGRLDSVGNDSFQGARVAVKHLIERGCREIGYVKAKQRIPNFQDRQRGALTALQEAKMGFACQISVDISADGAAADMEAWLDRGERLPDGLFIDNDNIAAAILRTLKRRGLRIPEDVCLVGIDDIPMCEMLEPPLSTVKLAKEELGTVAMDHLQYRIANGHVPHRMPGLHMITTMMSTRLVPRSTVRK